MKDFLSQEEIDALLKGSNVLNEELTGDEKEALLEMCSLAMDEVSDLLVSKLKEKVTIKALDLSDASDSDFEDTPLDLFAFAFELKGDVEGRVSFVLNTEDVRTLLPAEGEEASPDDSEDAYADALLSLVKEALPAAASAITKTSGINISSSLPKTFAPGKDNSGIKALLENEKMIKVEYSVEIGTAANIEMVQLMPFSMAKQTVGLLLGNAGGGEQVAYNDSAADKAPKPAKKRTPKPPKKQKKASVTIKSATFPSFDDEDAEPTYDENLDFIMDVPLRVSVELGSTTKTIKEILSYNIGSIIELNKLADDYVDVLVNGKLIARGEVIVVDENFGVRILEIYTQNRGDFLENK